MVRLQCFVGPALCFSRSSNCPPRVFRAAWQCHRPSKRSTGFLPRNIRLCHDLSNEYPRRSHVFVYMGSQSKSAESLIQTGFVVEFVTSTGHRRLGSAVRPDGKRNWIVIDTNGVSQSVTPKQISYIIGPLKSHPTILKEGVAVAETDPIAALQADCELRVDQTCELIETAWDIVRTREEDEGGPVTSLEELAELMFDDVSSQSLYATHVTLQRDRVYFKQKIVKGQAIIEARPEQQVAGTQLAIRAEKEKEELKRAMDDAIVSSFEGRDVSKLQCVVNEDDFQSFVFALRTIAEDCGSDIRDFSYVDNPMGGFASLDNHQKNSVRQIFGTLGKSVSPSTAFDVLCAWGIYKKHENLALKQSGLDHDTAFSSELLEDADARSVESTTDVDAMRRTDLRHVPCFAVDSADTDEIDDAIAWDDETERVWVHVADPLRFFPEGLESKLCSEALRRASTLYLPTAKLTMFPSDFAAEKVSIGGLKNDNVALSFGFKVLEDGSLDQSSVELCSSYISSPQRLTYEEVDDILAQEDHEIFQTINRLYGLAERRKGWRVHRGAVIIPNPFSKLVVKDVESDDPEISIGIIRTDTRSWTLVSELMITACSIAGDIGMNASIAMPYRCQADFERPSAEAIEIVPQGPARAAVAFKFAPPSEIRSDPAGHSSLGLQAYVQVTSPIRRSSDLIAHAQLKAYLRNEDPPFDKSAMNCEISKQAERIRSIRLVDQRTSKYWNYEYLRRLGSDKIHEAVFVRSIRDGEPSLGLVALCESAMQLVVRVPKGLKIGAHVDVRVLSVDPRRMSLAANAVAQKTEDVEDDALKEIDDAIEDLFSDVSVEDELE